jgi:hypothetical protein
MFLVSYPAIHIVAFEEKLLVTPRGDWIQWQTIELSPNFSRPSSAEVENLVETFTAKSVILSN